MLMHTKGILVMTPDSAMVLTGKQSLDYSGGVSAEDNFGIGGYDRVMGPNGQAQYWAPNLQAACDILFAHYDHAYVAPGERFPRRAETSDPADRDVRDYPHVHPSSEFTTVGDIFSASTNKDRKKPFDIRTVMRSVVDQDHPVLERWADMADADTAVVFDAHVAGIPVCVIGIESRAIPRKGWRPTDGPDQWTSGTLFPQSSKKTARAVNAASGNRPLVVLANLSGFDGSPESLRRIQLEYGAEIGRAVVNFDGPIVFCVISRYHGGAFVVFSNALNENMEVLAVEGSFASVIGGAPAAAVVFTREVNARTAADPAVRELETQLAASTDDAASATLRVKLAATRAAVRSDKLGEVASGVRSRTHRREGPPGGFGPLDRSGGRIAAKHRCGPGARDGSNDDRRRSLSLLATWSCAYLPDFAVAAVSTPNAPTATLDPPWRTDCGEHGPGLDLLGEVGDGSQIDPRPHYRHAGTLPQVHTVVAEPGRRVEQHLRFLALLGSVVVEPTAGGPLVERRATGDRRGQPALTGQEAGVGALLVLSRCSGSQRRQETPAGAPAQSAPTRGRTRDWSPTRP